MKHRRDSGYMIETLNTESSCFNYLYYNVIVYILQYSIKEIHGSRWMFDYSIGCVGVLPIVVDFQSTILEKHCKQGQ